MNATEKPYALEPFSIKELELVKDDNSRVHRIYPPPYDSTYPTIDYPTEDECSDSPSTGSMR